MTEEFRIPYPDNPKGRKSWSRDYGFNRFYAGVHWAKRKQAADYWHRLTRRWMALCGCRETPFGLPVRIEYFFNDRLDSTNHSVMVKMIEDAMKGVIIYDDNRRWVKGFSVAFHDEDCILVRVTEIPQPEKTRKRIKKPGTGPKKVRKKE